MIRGSFSQDGDRLVVHSEVFFPDFDTLQFVPFIFDTGAPSTSLPIAYTPTIDPSKVSKRVELSGIGGSVRGYVVNAVVSFSDGILRFEYHLEVTLGEYPAGVQPAPPLLGMDVAKHWVVHIDPRRHVFTCDPFEWTLRKPDGPTNLPPQRGSGKI